MIITITMNPAIDKTVQVQELKIGALNRIAKVHEDAGGKGINVSKTIRSLGGESHAMGFLGGMAGWQIEHCLDQLFIRHAFVRIHEGTRTNQKVVDALGHVTELNEPGPEVSESELAQLFTNLEKTLKVGDYVVLCGSLPKGVPADTYARLVHLIHEKSAFAFVDADGESLRLALEEGPDVVKPNLDELTRYMEQSGALPALQEEATRLEVTCEVVQGMRTPAEAVNMHCDLKEELSQERYTQVALAILMGKQLQKKGIREVIVSLGEEGAVFLYEKGTYYIPALTVDAASTVGAGDALVAAYTLASDRGASDLAKMSLSVAASAGAVTTKGTSPAEKAVVDALLPEVKILRLECP